MSNPNSITRGAHHVGLTVPNLAETRQFFLQTLGFEQVGDVPDYPAVFLKDTNTMITLWDKHPNAGGVPNAAACDDGDIVR